MAIRSNTPPKLVSNGPALAWAAIPVAISASHVKLGKSTTNDDKARQTRKGQNGSERKLENFAKSLRTACGAARSCAAAVAEHPASGLPRGHESTVLPVSSAQTGGERSKAEGSVGRGKRWPRALNLGGAAHEKSDPKVAEGESKLGRDGPEMRPHRGRPFKKRPALASYHVKPLHQAISEQMGASRFPTRS